MIWRRFILVPILMIACFQHSAFVWAEEPTLQIHVTRDESKIPVSFEAQGLSADKLAPLKTLRSFDPEFANVFGVYLVDKNRSNDLDDIPAISGNYKIDGNTLTFVPRHSLQHGLTYRVVLRPMNGAAKSVIRRDVTVPERSVGQSVETTVSAIYPSADKLPENLLRFYIQFSQPMSRRDAYQYLRLLDEADKPVEAAFLEIGEELWDPSGCRFTLLLDPGRVKQGLRPREELGAVLQTGKMYTLLVKQGWRDEQGHVLKSEFRKSFAVGPVVNQAIQWKKWVISAPLAGTTDPISVKFDRTLDHALLGRMLSVEDEAGRRVTGTIETAAGETVWRLRPGAEWPEGSYRLKIDCALEDPAGNRIDRSFEVVRESSNDEVATRKYEQIPFEVLKRSE